MKKKKAIKIAAATAMAASSFTAVAPFSTEAAVNVSASVTTATTQMQKAYNTYYAAAKKGQAVSAATVQTQVNLAQKYYATAQTNIKKYAGSKKSYYTSKLNAALPYLKNAKNYISGEKYAEGVKKQAAALEADVLKGYTNTVASAFDAYSTKLAGAEQKVRDYVPGKTAENVVIKANLKTPEANLPLLKAYVFASKAVYWISIGAQETAQARLDVANTEYKKVSATSNLGQAVSDYIKSIQDKFAAKFTAVKAVSPVADITVTEGETANLPKSVTVTTANGATKDVAVTWDTATLDTKTAGTYTLVGAIDGTNIPAQVTVVVKAAADATAPVITLNGEANVSLDYGQAYTDAGATATDNKDAHVTVTSEITDAAGNSVSAIDGKTAGTYTVTYTAYDAAGNKATATRTVVVKAVGDTEAPVITLNGDATVNLVYGTAYTEAGATVTDNKDTNLQATVAIKNEAGDPVDAIDGKTAGTYTVTYTAVDAAGNQATPVTRTVVVAPDATAAISAVNGAATDAIQGVLETNAQLLGLDLSAYNKLGDTYKAAVASAVYKGKSVQPSGAYTDAASVKTAFDNAVALQTGYSDAAASVTVINNVAATSTDTTYDADATMQVALEAQAASLNLDLTNYNKLGIYGKKQVAHSVLTNRPAGGYTTAAALTTEFNSAVTTQSNSLTDAVKAVNNVLATPATPATADVASMTNALTNNANPLDLSVATGSDYALLDSAYQSAVAQAVITNMPSTSTSGTTTYAYANAGAIKTAFDAAVAAQKAKEATDLVKLVNSAITATDVQTILGNANEAKVLGLNTTDYNTLGSAKSAVAQAIFDGKGIQPSGLYADSAAIQTAFNAAVAYQKAQSVTAAVTAINNVTVANASAPTDTEGTNMKSALETYAGLLGLSIGTSTASDYDNLTNKVNVGIAVLKTRPATGFTAAADVKTAFDAAVAAEKDAETQSAINAAVNAVNTASTATEMQTAIQTTAYAASLGLAISTNADSSASDYSKLSDTNKTAVAQKVLNDRAIQLNQKYASADAIKAEFNTSVAYYKAVQAGNSTTAALSAVNNGTTGTMQSVLESNADILGLAVGSPSNKTDYTNLGTTFKDAVAQAVLKAKPTGGYTSSSDVVTAFNTAVTEQKAAQAAEDASILAINNVAMATVTPTDAEGTAMQSALEANAKVLNINVSAGSDYDALSNAAKLQVAKSVLTARYGVSTPTAHQFATATEIQNAFNTAVTTAKGAQTTAVNAISAATDVTTMQNLLETNAAILSLDLTDYNTFTLGQKQVIAQSVIDGQKSVSGGVYSSAASIKTVFTNAVANVKAGNESATTGVAAVNSATTATIQSVLVSNASVLGIDVSSTSNYSKLASDADRAAVASAVLDAKPANGYATAADVKKAFNNAIAVNMVNNATTVTAMSTALGNLSTELGIDFSKVVDQSSVATAVLNNKAVQAGGKYADVASIKVVYNNAAFGDSIAPVLTSFALTDNGKPVSVDLTVASPTIDLSAGNNTDIISSATFNVKDNLSVTDDVIKVTFSGVTKTYSAVQADNFASVTNNVSLSDLIGTDNGTSGVSLATLRSMATAGNTNTLKLDVDLSDAAGNHTTGTLNVKVK